ARQRGPPLCRRPTAPGRRGQQSAAHAVPPSSSISHGPEAQPPAACEAASSTLWCRDCEVGTAPTMEATMNVSRILLTAALLLTAPAVGWGFEGTLKLRTVSIERAQLGKVTGGAAPDSAQILAITPKQLLDAKDAGAEMRESTVYVTPTKVRMDAPL